MPTTIFNTPILSGILHYVSRALLRVTGWRVEGQLPDMPKFVLIAAPHTSNWDFVVFLVVIFRLRANVRFMGKSELFRWPFGYFFRWCGGVPVDRSKSSGLVEQMTSACRESERFILTIAPEGTRDKVRAWKSGFYHIAKQAGIPIVLAVLDGVKKSISVGQIFHPTENMEADMQAIQGFFANKTGIKPALTSAV